MEDKRTTASAFNKNCSNQKFQPLNTCNDQLSATAVSATQETSPPNNQTKKLSSKRLSAGQWWKEFVSPPKQRRKREIDSRYQWKRSFRSKDNIFKSNFKFHNPKQFQTLAIFQKAWKQLTSKQSSWIQTILGKIKLKGGSKISKIWENSCSCNNWRLLGEPRSLDNFFLK